MGPNLTAGKNWQERLLLLSFFAAVFLYFSSPLGVTTDFWWHLATGRWIFENAALPLHDPFLFTSTSTEDQRVLLILRGYWLADLLYFLLYTLWRSWWTLIFFKAISFTALFGLIYCYLKKNLLDTFTCLLLLGGLVLLSNSYDEVRPQFFSFLGVALILYLLDNGIRKARTKITSSPLVFLPLLMALWANLHPGFILGWLILGIYACSELYQEFTNTSTQRPLIDKLRVPAALFGSGLCALLNPNTWAVVISTLNSVIFFETINEYQNSLRYFLNYGSYLQLSVFILLLCILFMLVATSWKRFCLAHKILFIVAITLGISSFRYLFIGMSVAIMLAGANHNQNPKATNILLKRLTLLTVVILVGFLLYRGYERSSIGREPLRGESAAKIVALLDEQNFSDPIFNPYEWGGFLIWHLGHKHQFFYDARTLSFPVYMDYTEAVSGKKSVAFDKYGINTVVYPLFAPTPKITQIPALIYSLLKDPLWELAYADEYATAFVKQGTSPLVPRKNKDQYVLYLVNRFKALAATQPENQDALLILGQLAYTQGNMILARQYFSKALAVAPDNKLAKQWLDYLK